MKNASKPEKIRVLLIDDEDQARDQMFAALFRVQNGAAGYERLRSIALELFDIREFAIPGAAILAVEKENYRPDLAVIDISYESLNRSELRDKKFDPVQEISRVRGFDLMQALHEYSPATRIIFFTGKADADPEVLDNLSARNLRLGRDYLIKTDKALGFTALSMWIQDCFASLLDQHAEKVGDGFRARLRALLAEEATSGAMLDEKMPFNDRPVALRHLLIFKGAFDLGLGRMVWDERQLNPYLADSFFLNAPDPEEAVEDFGLRGLWQKAWVRRRIVEWRNSASYHDQNREIDEAAEAYLRRTLDYQRRGKIFEAPEPFVKDSNIGRNDRPLENPNFLVLFLNALKTRRALIGLSAMAANPVWGQGRNTTLGVVLDLHMNNNGRRATPENMRVHLSQVLGLSNTLNIPQTIEVAHILDEERSWLKERFPALLAEARGVIVK